MTKVQRAARRWGRMGLRVVLSAVAVTSASIAAAPQTTRPAPLFPEPTTMPLWSSAAPGALGDADADIPTITVFMPRETAGPLAAVVIAPGGSYVNLASNHEGRQPAAFFNSLGMAAFVLKYRLGPIPPSNRARRRAARDPHRARSRVRMAHRAGSDRHDGLFRRQSPCVHDLHAFRCRRSHGRRSHRSRQLPPRLRDPRLPGITFEEAWTHQGSKNNLLGPSPDPALVGNLSNETQVTAQTPQTFIFQTSADTVVPAENAVSYYLALRKAGVPAEMHIFRDGPHGVGLGMMDPSLSEWPTLLKNWLRATGVIR